MSNNIRIAICVDSDLEAAAIVSLARESGVPVHAALSGGVPAKGGTAYKVDSFDPPIPFDFTGTLLRIECDGPVFAGLERVEYEHPMGGGDPIAHHLPSPKVVVVDHHREGDPGFGLPPGRYIGASSIGQVVDFLCGEGVISQSALLFFRLRPYLMMVAACDHCLEAAYRGLCPGVSPDDLLEFRIAQRAQIRGVSPDVVRADIEAAQRKLRDTIGDCRRIYYADESGQSHHVPQWATELADLRGLAPIPELPEAACRDGIPFLAEQADRDGRRKVVLMAVPQGSDLVQRFMAGEIIPGLVDHYGDPARGYAGAYYPAPRL